MPNIIQVRRAVLSAPPVVAAAPTTVYDLTFTGNNGGSGAGLTEVFTAPNASTSAASGSQLRVTVEFNSFVSGATALIYVGQKGAGDAYDFTGTQVQLLWSGVGTITGDGSTMVYTSDWVTLGEAYDETKDYNFAAQFAGSAGTVRFATVNLTGANAYFGAATDAATTNKSGYSQFLTDIAAFIKKIEIR